MPKNIIGRAHEQKKLNSALNSNRAEFIAVYGRRRVGKTYLIENSIETNGFISLSVTGIKDGNIHEQLSVFTSAIEKTFDLPYEIAPVTTWKQAFNLLTKLIKTIPSDKKFIIFLDELPWLATVKSGLMQTLDHYWNTIWRRMDNVKLIVCGSAAGWMIDNLINDKGGLHNRVTLKLSIRPFDIKQTKEYLKYRGITLNHKQVLDLYLIMGGIPYYIDAIQKGKSAVENINELCFTVDGLLYNEFDNLYRSLFKNADAYLEIIRAMAKHRFGIEQNLLLSRLKLSSSGGTFSKRLEELEQAGFIISFTPYGKNKKDRFYRIVDEYTLFYLSWIEPALNRIKLATKQSHYWQSKSTTAAWKSWVGYAFESFCYQHIPHIIKALDLKVGYDIGSWSYHSNGKQEKGVQIDLLLDRDDGVINIIEIKYNDSPYRITKAYATQLWDKLDVFKEKTGTKKQLFLTLLTVNGLTPNLYVDELVTNSIDIESFFED